MIMDMNNPPFIIDLPGSDIRKERRGPSAPAGIPGIPVETLEALRQGDHTAYREVYLHYITPITRFLKLLTASEHDAEEIAQEVFINVWEKRERIDPAGNIKSFLYAIARNAALDHFKHKKVRQKYADNILATADEDSVSSEEIVIAKETEILIRIAVERMPKQRRTIFSLSRYEGLSNDEIAARLNISKNTVENHLTSAKKDIREVIAFFILLFIAS